MRKTKIWTQVGVGVYSQMRKIKRFRWEAEVSEGEDVEEEDFRGILMNMICQEGVVGVAESAFEEEEWEGEDGEEE